MKNTENQRLKILRETMNVSQKDFANQLTMQPGSLADVERGKVGVSSKLKRSLTMTNSNININWLETGEGEMFIESVKNNSADSSPPDKNYDNKDEVTTTIHENQAQYESSILSQVNTILNKNSPPNPKFKPIPVYEQGYENGQNISLLMQAIDIIPAVILVNGKRHTGCDMVIKHKDRAMTGALSHGCYIGIKQLFEYHDQIIPGMMCVLVLSEFTIERFVYPGNDDDHFLLKSAEPAVHIDMTIKISKIKELWLIKSWSKPVEIEDLM